MTGLRMGRREAAIVASGLAISAGSWLAFRPFDLTDAFMIGAPFGRDFVNFWIGPHLALDGRTAALFDSQAYNAAIRESFGYLAQNRMIFSYPPHALLLLLPFGAMPYLPALLLWTGLNLGALWLATRRLGDAGRALPALVCLSPASAAMVMYGHFGGLLALGATITLQEGERRPALAGLCMALMSVKPQFTVVLGLLLLCAGRIAWIPAALAGTALLVGLSLAAFGAETWELFVSVTLPLQSRLLTEFAASSLATATSFYVTARFWDLPSGIAWAVQGLLGGLCFLAAAMALRGGPLDARRLFVVLAGALLALPYANHYDLAVAAPALTLLVLDRTGRPEHAPSLTLAWLVPPMAKLLTVAAVPVIPLVLGAALLTAARRPQPQPTPVAGAVPC